MHLQTLRCHTNPKVKKRVQETDDEDTDSEDEDNNEKLPVCDISPQTLKTLFTACVLKDTWQARGQSTSNLIAKVEQLIGVTDRDTFGMALRLLLNNKRGAFGLSSYFQLIETIQELMSSHGAKFARGTVTPSEMYLVCKQSGKQ